MAKPAMSLLSLIPPETFDLPVSIPRAGHPPAVVRFTFRRRMRSEMLALTEELRRLDDAPCILRVAVDWELSDPFNAENVRTLCETLPGAGYAVVQAYLDATFGHRKH